MAIPNAQDWQTVFDEVFEEIEDSPLDSSAHSSFDALRPLIYSSKGTATYKCNTCKRTWQSINALVEFEYRLSRRHTHDSWVYGLDSDDFGSVKLVLNGQKCKGSSCGKEFVKPIFQQDSIVYVLEKLLVKVKAKFYEDQMENLEERYANLQVNYQPTGRGSHIPELCEGCAKGLCKSKATVNGEDGGPRKLFGRRNGPSYTSAVNIYVKWELSM